MKPEKDEQFDGSDSERLAHDLKALYEPKGLVPPQVDRAVMDLAARRLAARPKHRRFIHWPAYAASAAAVIVICLLVSDLSKKPQPDGPVAPVANQMDINADGVVDVLDAFKLAKAVDSDAAGSQWDMNADGVVDSRDVDHVATAAVRLNQEVL